MYASPGSAPLTSPFAQPLQELPGAQNIEARLGELRLNSPDSLTLISQGVYAPPPPPPPPPGGPQTVKLWPPESSVE